VCIQPSKHKSIRSPFSNGYRNVVFIYPLKRGVGGRGDDTEWISSITVILSPLFSNTHIPH